MTRFHRLLFPKHLCSPLFIHLFESPSSLPLLHQISPRTTSSKTFSPASPTHFQRLSAELSSPLPTSYIQLPLHAVTSTPPVHCSCSSARYICATFDVRCNTPCNAFNYDPTPSAAAAAVFLCKSVFTTAPNMQKLRICTRCIWGNVLWPRMSVSMSSRG